MAKETSEGGAIGIGGRGLSLFHLGGIEVRLDYTWFLIFLLVLVGLATGYFPRFHPDGSTAAYWAAGTVTTLLLFVSIVLHELSHAWMAQAAGIPVPSITLFLFGGVSQMAEEPSDPATELRVAAVGPLMSLALAVVFWGIHAALEPVAPPMISGIALYLAIINVALAIFNLLPGLPLDGGRVLRAFAWWRTGSLRRGTRVATTAGKGIAVGLMILGGLEIFAGALVGGIWLILIGLFLRGTAEAGYQNLVILQSLEDVDVSQVAIRDLVTVAPGLTLQALVDDYFLAHGYRAYPVVEDSTVKGLISIEALREIGADERRSKTVSDAMTTVSDDNEVAPEVPLSDALKKLARAPAGRLLVRDASGRLQGMLTKEGLARFLEIRRVLEESGGDVRRAESASSEHSEAA
jgi:Zn-dependent protease/CBS domain-containing protein